MATAIAEVDIMDAEGSIALPVSNGKHLESRNGVNTLEHAEAIGLGSREYELVTL